MTNVAIIDDDPVFQLITRINLNRQKLAKNVLMFNNGKDAIDFFNAAAAMPGDLPDVIFLDINMPIMDGWHFLEEFLALKPQIEKEITIYVVSSSVDPIDRDRAKTISAVTGYLVKPVNEGDLAGLFEHA